MIFLDTNVLVRYFTGDDPHKANQCEKLLREARAGRVQLFVTHLLIAEILWILSKKYQIPKLSVIEGIRRLLNTPHVFCDQAPLLLAALNLFETKSLSFIDAYHAVFLPARGITEIYSYDTDFDQVAGITRKEP